MTREEITKTLLDHRAAFQAEGAVALYLYGSRARNDHKLTSDVDLFVDYDPNQRFSLFNLAGLKHKVEGLLGLSVHVTTRDSLHPRILPRIQNEAVKIY